MVKKKRPAAEEWTLSSAQAFLDEQQAALASKDPSYVDAATAAVCDVGMRLPYLSQRFLFQRTTIPFERSLLLFGTPGASKSALLYDFYGLGYRNGGRYLHIETEDKDSPTLRLAFTNYDKGAGTARPCPSMDQFQTTFKAHINWYKGVCAKANGPGLRVPWVYGVDSLVAKLTEEAAAKMDKNAGAAERRFSDESRSLSDWFKYAPKYLQGLPVLLVAVNHDKPKADPTNPRAVVHQRPGGYAPDFYATYRILVQRIRDLPMSANGWEGKRIKLSMDKCALGADKMSIQVDYVYRLVPAESVAGTRTVRQQAEFRWAKASVETLMALSESDRSGARGKAVDDVLGLRKETGGRYTCDRLGVKEPIPPTELGELLERSPEALAELEPRLGIHPSREFVPGVDFAEQLAAARAAVDEFMPAPDHVVVSDDDLPAAEVPEPGEASSGDD